MKARDADRLWLRIENRITSTMKWKNEEKNKTWSHSKMSLELYLRETTHCAKLWRKKNFFWSDTGNTKCDKYKYGVVTHTHPHTSLQHISDQIYTERGSDIMTIVSSARWCNIIQLKLIKCSEDDFQKVRCFPKKSFVELKMLSFGFLFILFFISICISIFLNVTGELARPGWRTQFFVIWKRIRWEHNKNMMWIKYVCFKWATGTLRLLLFYVGCLPYRMRAIKLN